MTRADVLVDADWLDKHVTEPNVVVIGVDEDGDAYYTHQATATPDSSTPAARGGTRRPAPGHRAGPAPGVHLRR